MNARKDQLLAEKTDLESQLSRFAKPTGAPGAYETTFPEDIGSRQDENASEVEEYVDHLSLEQTLEARLKDVMDALSKIESGTYGVCEETGEEISQARLEANPAARTTVHPE
ncbi:MAG: TraR/DksA C4-type zinc finger protein [Candidatus Moranbacteria bacterium]|nr:TraR/DksA C4-type zinc finger protein [Candidatus Moranbacteria bacterium]